MENSSVEFQSVLRAVRRAKNDSEMFAALLIVTKLVKAENLSLEDKKELFKAIGIMFPIRLISSANKDDDSQKLFVSIGASVLSLFVTDESFAQSPEIILAVSKLVTAFCQVLDDSHSDRQIVISDFLHIMCSVSACVDGSRALLRSTAVDILCKYYESESDHSQRDLACLVLINLARLCPDLFWAYKGSCINDFLSTISSNFVAVNTELKFKLATQITDLFSTMPSDVSAVYANQPWMGNAVNALADILRSRISSKERNPALMLCHCLTEAFGFGWTTKGADVQGGRRRFPVILTSVSCIEIGMISYEDTQNDALVHEHDAEQLQLLLACFNILEKACACIADFDQEEGNSSPVFTFEDIQSLDASLKDAVNAVVGIVDKLLSRDDANDLLLACARFLGSWLNVELFAASEVGVRIAPTVVSAFRLSLESNPTLATRFAIPALMNYVGCDKVQACLLRIGIADTLCDLAVSVCLSREDKALALQCLIGFVVEQQVENTGLTDKLTVLIDVIVAKQSENDVVINYYFTVLILVLWNRADKKTGDPHSVRFFQFACTLVHGTHSLNKDRLEVAKTYVFISLHW